MKKNLIALTLFALIALGPVCTSCNTAASKTPPTSTPTQVVIAKTITIRDIKRKEISYSDCDEQTTLVYGTTDELFQNKKMRIVWDSSKPYIMGRDIVFAKKGYLAKGRWYVTEWEKQPEPAVNDDDDD